MVKLKYLIPIIFLVSLFGCKPAEVKTVYQNVYLPTYIVPKPPMPDKPTLYISTMTDAQKADIGELSKGYVISFKQVMQYACLMNKIVNKYNDLSNEKPGTVPPVVALTDQDQQDCDKK